MASNGERRARFAPQSQRTSRGRAMVMSLGSASFWGRVFLITPSELAGREAQEAGATKPMASRQGDPVMTRVHSARPRPPTSTVSAPPRPPDAPGGPPAQAQPSAGRNGGDPLVREVRKQAVVAVAGWLILLGLTLLTLSTLTRQPPPVSPVEPVRSKVAAPGFSGGIQHQQPDLARESNR